MKTRRDMITLYYPVGSRVKLIQMKDPQAPRPGTEGTVKYVDDLGQIHVDWDTGGSLALIIEADRFERIS